jgi:hypothetical protein
VVVRGFGGAFTEKWWGSVDGRTFSFRAKRGQWGVELDLRPTGQYVEVLADGVVLDPAASRLEEIEEGSVVAAGTTDDPGCGSSVVERAHFIVGVVRDYLLRESCQVHSVGRAELERRLRSDMVLCPACGTRLATWD